MRFPDLDRPAVLALNAAHVTETGPLSAAELDRLLALAFHAEAPRDAQGRLLGFVTALEHDRPDWPSLPYGWFRARGGRFVYVDRIVVAPAARGTGTAARLYEGLFAAARAAGHARVCAEVNLEPPNPVSMRFHERMGFAEVGRGPLPSGKTVRYLERPL